MSLELLKKDVANIVESLKPELLALSHAIHQEPELALEEFKAVARLTGAVESHDLPVQRESFGLKTSYVSEFGEGPSIAILSEYDALPGVGHACGHNVIATAGLGAVLALAKLGKRLPGRVRYLGTPAEERFGGKEMIAREGAFDRVDAAMMIHPANLNMVTMPCIAISEVEVTYHGRAAHASAMPYRGLNALDAVVNAYQSIAQLRQHIRQTERIHGIITEGGLAANIVPGAAGMMDPATESIAASEYLYQGAQALRSSGISNPTGLDVRGYYNFGPAGGEALAHATNDQPISSVLSTTPAATLRANGITPGETVGQWRASVTAKIGNAATQSVLT